MMKTMADFIQAIHIFSKYDEDGLNSCYFLEAEHDIIYSHISINSIPEDSQAGKTLTMLGWHVDTDIEVWAYFT